MAGVEDYTEIAPKPRQISEDLMCCTIAHLNLKQAGERGTSACPTRSPKGCNLNTGSPCLRIDVLQIDILGIYPELIGS